MLAMKVGLNCSPLFSAQKYVSLQKLGVSHRVADQDSLDGYGSGVSPGSEL